jgi:hypothetical protein
MRIRPITADEITAFAALTYEPAHSQSIYDYLERLFTQAATKLAWCFVAAEDDRFLGRLAYWAPPKVGIPSDIVLFDVLWAHDYATIGTNGCYRDLAQRPNGD